jgi:dTDP-4-amino-4,6-dideoxygalactose transaminase
LAANTLASEPSVTTPSKPQFPFLDLHAQYAGIKDEVVSAVTRVLEEQRFILGPEVQQLESEVARLAGCGFG